MDIETTSPIKLFEYMASRTPIVSSKIPTIEKIIKHENEAYLAHVNDMENIIYYIKKLLNNKNLSKQLADNAYEKVKEYTYRKRCYNILNYFEIN